MVVFASRLRTSLHLQCALKGGSGQAVVACDMTDSCKFPSLGSRQRRLLWSHKGVDLAPHPVVGLVLQVGDVEKFPQALGFEGLDPFIRVSKQGPCFTTIEEDGGGKRLVELERSCDADGIAPPDPVLSDHC